MEDFDEPAAESLPLTAGLTLASVVEFFEGWLAVLFAASVALMGVCGLVVLSEWPHLDRLQRSLDIVWLLGWVSLDVPYLFRLIIIAIRNRRPFALTAALEQRVPPLLLRPIIVLWWLAHLALGGLAATVLYGLFFEKPQTDWFTLFMALGMGLAAHGFLMLSVCAATQSATLRMKIWRFRIILDLMLVGIGILLAKVDANSHSDPPNGPTHVVVNER